MVNGAVTLPEVVSIIRTPFSTILRYYYIYMCIYYVRVFGDLVYVCVFLETIFRAKCPLQISR